MFKTLIATSNLPVLGPQPRAGRQTIADLNQIVDRYVAGSSMPGNLKGPLRSAAFLWHDHLEASHEISQGIHTPNGSFLHGIMHRREPDYGNAKYWFQRAGKHPAYLRLTDQVASLLEARHERELLSLLAPKGNWAPAAFVDACEQAERRPGDGTAILRLIQEIEFDSLLAHLFEE